MTKAQKGDLIRVVSLDNGKGLPEAFDSAYNIGDILEVSHASGKVTITTNECYLFDHEYEIHSKAGEEDSELVVESIKDNVNSPNHYTQGRVEVIDIIEDSVQGADPFEAVCQANILKYTLRYRAKNGVEDLKKAKWYMERLIKHLDEMF